MGKKAQRVGDQLQKMINSTNDNYKMRKMACMIQQHEEVKAKSKLDENGKKVLYDAYHKSKGGLDYAGVVKGRYVSFDAKSAADRLPFDNIKDHQIKTMIEIEENGGHAFILAYIRNKHACYLIPASYIVPLYKEWEEHKNMNQVKGKKERYEGGASLNEANLNENAFVVVPSIYGLIDWLPAYERYLKSIEG